MGNFFCGEVEKKITAQEHNDVLTVLFHLEQTLRLHDEQLMKLLPLGIDEKDLEG